MLLLEMRGNDSAVPFTFVILIAPSNPQGLCRVLFICLEVDLDNLSTDTGRH